MKTEILYFSATNTTKSIVKAISTGLDGEVYFTDITQPSNRLNYQKMDCDLTIIAVPIYGERVPRFLYDFFCQIPGDGRLLAVAAFVGQHTYATKKAPVAYGRPDEEDLQQARIFGENIQRKVKERDVSSVALPRTVLPKFITEFPDSGTRFLIRQPVFLCKIASILNHGLSFQNRTDILY